MKMKKTISMLLALILCSTMLAACGGNGSSSSSDPNLGKWTAAAVRVFGDEIDIGDFYDAGAWIELKTNGNCTMMFDGDTGNGKYTISGSRVTFSSGGAEYDATIEGNVLTFELLDDIYIIYAKDGTTYTRPSADAPSYSPGGTANTPAPRDNDLPGSGGLAEALAWWEGDWYGVMYIYDASEEFEDSIGDYEDVYAVIKTDPAGAAVVYLWSENNEMGTVQIQINADGGGVMGSATSVGGELFGYSNVGGHWTILPAISQYDNMIEIREIWTDPDLNWVNYEMLLRPWGMDWEDVPYADQPYYYDWYAGVCDRPMLDVVRESGEMNHSQIN